MRFLFLQQRSGWLLLLLTMVFCGLASHAAAASERLMTEFRAGPRLALSEVLPDRHVLLGTGLAFTANDGFVASNDEFRAYRQRFAAAMGIARGLQVRAEVFYARAHNRFTTPQTLVAFGDAELGLRGVWKVVADFYAGFDTALKFYAGDGAATHYFSATSWDVRHVGGYRRGRLHTGYQIGYVRDRSARAVGGTPTLVESAAYNLAANDRLPFGLRADVAAGRFLPFVEYVADFVWGGPIAARRGPQWLSLGSGITMVKGLSVTPAIAFGVVQPKRTGVPTAQPWMLQLGLVYGFDAKQALYRLKQWLDPDPAVLNIDVIDAFRKRAISAARVTLYAGAVTATGEGGLRWVGYAARATYAVTAPYYSPATGMVLLSGGRKTTAVVELKPTVGWVRGRVLTPAPDNRAYLVLHDGSRAVSTVVHDRFELAFAPGLYAGFLTATGAVSRPVDLAVAAGVDIDLGEMILLARVPRAKRLPSQTNAAGEQVWYFFDASDRDSESAAEAEPGLASMESLVGDADAVLADIRRQAVAGDLGRPTTPASPQATADDGQGQVGSFGVGETELTRGDLRKVRELAEMILNDPSIAYVVIEGGADDTGSQAVNARISRQRAYSVANELHKYGVPDGKVAIKIEYYVRGAPEATAEARARERRVAVRVIRHGS